MHKQFAYILFFIWINSIVKMIETDDMIEVMQFNYIRNGKIKKNFNRNIGCVTMSPYFGTRK